MNNIVKSLTTLPATDGNFLSALNRATNEDLTEAINIMKDSDGQHKSRITACEKELKKQTTISKELINTAYAEIKDFRDKFGEMFYDFFMKDSNNTLEISKGIIAVLSTCKTKAELEVANDMIAAICGYNFCSIVNEIKKRDAEDYAWESVW